jgi:hypothetical protein
MHWDVRLHHFQLARLLKRRRDACSNSTVNFNQRFMPSAVSMICIILPVGDARKPDPLDRT